MGSLSARLSAFSGRPEDGFGLPEAARSRRGTATASRSASGGKIMPLMRELAAPRIKPFFTLAQIASADLNIAVLGQLPTPDLPLGNQFEPCSLQMVRFQAPLRRRRLVKQGLEHPAGNPDNALVLADADAELDRSMLAVPSGIGRKSEKH